MAKAHSKDRASMNDILCRPGAQLSSKGILPATSSAPASTAGRIIAFFDFIFFRAEGVNVARACAGDQVLVDATWL